MEQVPQPEPKQIPALPVPDFRAAFESAPGAFLLVLPDDPAFTIIAASDHYVQLSGVAREKLLGRGVFEVFPDNPENAAANGLTAVTESFRRVIATRSTDKLPSYRYDVERPFVEGGRFEERWWNQLNTPVIGWDNSVQYLLHSVEEVTDKVRAEERERLAITQLRTSNTRFRQLAETSTLGLVIGDMEGGLSYLNPSIRKLLGYTEEEVALGLVRWNQLTPPEFSAQEEEAVRQLSDTGQCAPYEKVYVAKNGRQIPVLVGASLLDSANGKPAEVAAFIVDLTERKRVLRRDAFLVRLDDAVRPLTDPNEITLVASRLLAEYLRVDRVVYCSFEPDEDTFCITSTCIGPKASPMTGRFNLAQFGAAAISLFRAAVPYVVDDIETDSRTADTRTAYRETGIRAHASVALHKAGRLVAAFGVHQGTPRQWQPDEIELIQHVANRCWESLQRALSQASLRQQWHTFDTALSHTPDFTYIFDLEGRFTYVNRALLSLWQKDLEDAVGKNFFELGYPPELAARLQRQIQEVIATKGPVRDHTPFTGPTGETRQYEYIFVPVFSRDAAVEAVAGSTRDITDRERAEESLRKNDERQSFMLDLLQKQRKSSNPERIMRSAAEALGRYLKVDRTGFFEMPDDDTLRFLVGWTAGRLPLLDGTFPAVGIGTRYLEEVRAGKTIGITDTRTDPLTADSMFLEIETVSSIGVPIIRHGRWHAGFYVNHSEVRDWADHEVALVRDVGEQTWDAVERARAEIALRQSEEQLRIERERLDQVFSQAPIAICVLRGRDMVFELVNPHYQQLFPGRTLLNRPLVEAIPEAKGEVLAILREVLETGVPFAANEYKMSLHRDEDGAVEDYWFTFVYHPLREADGTVSAIVAVAVDVTSHVQAMQDLKRANRELEEFAYVASHDLQEPLRMVNIYTQLLLRRADGQDANLNQYAAFIRQGVGRMEGLIRDLLTFSRTVHTDDLPVGAADLSAAVKEAASVLQARIDESGATITVEPLPTVRGDTEQMAHVFQNLFSNALKYCQQDRSPKIHIAAEQNGEEWIVSVRDNGIGFEQKYATSIFGLFKRLHKDAYPGTGLGLAICQRIVERYGGRMWAESQPGAGAVFYFALPRTGE